MKVVKYPNLIAEIARRGENQLTLAKILGISREQVNKRFNGKVKWKIDDINKVCDYYGKSYEELFK